MRIAFIGGGNMGRAMLSAILNQDLTSPQNIIVSDKNPEILVRLRQDFNVFTTEDNFDAASRGNIIVLAIKPQNLEEVMPEIKGKLNKNQLVLSIIAGRSIATLQNGLEHAAIIRAMPNTPAYIGKGITVWTATEGVTNEQKEKADAILKAMGKELYITDENFIDMSTAISGSGPAYVFLFIKSLIDAAVDIGLPPDAARQLVLQTLAGSVEFTAKSGMELAQLMQMVTSPGGTTAESLKVFENGKFKELIAQAVNAAYRKAKQIRG
ncbi:MAG: pyrroline-5-carboxylate reductase [Dehalococcoidia bacterium]|nr:MAG: pyrroline-5-carboxylate reductase [Dehalococcoidia bacterium]